MRVLVIDHWDVSKKNTLLFTHKRDIIQKNNKLRILMSLHFWNKNFKLRVKISLILVLQTRHLTAEERSEPSQIRTFKILSKDLCGNCNEVEINETPSKMISKFKDEEL